MNGNMADTSRIENEKAFHNESFSTGLRSKIDSYYEIFVGIRAEFRRRVAEAIRGENALELGCGPSTFSPEFAALAAHIKGIDISEEAVRQSEERAKAAGLSNVDFQVMNAEELQIPDASLALIFGSGIIHHLDLEAFFAEAKRVLQPQGRILFMEPLGHNPLINAYRNRTPGMRTPDEHPLLKKDLNNLAQHFSNLNIKYYYFWSLFAIPFRRFWVFKPMLSLLDGMDQLMFKMLPFSRTWAWYALIDASGPKATKK